MGRLQVVLRPFRPLIGVLRSTHHMATAVPALVDAILTLPTITRQLEIVAFQTATLAEMYEELAQIRSDTAALPRLDVQLARVNEVLCRVDLNTQAVQQLTEVALPLHGAALRLGRFADRLPQRRADIRAERNDG
jgi:hypothetical protein